MLTRVFVLSFLRPPKKRRKCPANHFIRSNQCVAQRPYFHSLPIGAARSNISLNAHCFAAAFGAPLWSRNNYYIILPETIKHARPRACGSNARAPTVNAFSPCIFPQRLLRARVSLSKRDVHAPTNQPTHKHTKLKMTLARYLNYKRRGCSSNTRALTLRHAGTHPPPQRTPASER